MAEGKLEEIRRALVEPSQANTAAAHIAVPVDQGTVRAMLACVEAADALHTAMESGTYQQVAEAHRAYCVVRKTLDEET